MLKIIIYIMVNLGGDLDFVIQEKNILPIFLSTVLILCLDMTQCRSVNPHQAISALAGCFKRKTDNLKTTKLLQHSGAQSH